MSNIKRFSPYVLVGIISALCTLGILFALNSYSSKQPFFSFSDANSSETNGHFTNSNVRLVGTGTSVEFVQAAEKTVNAVVSIKNYSSQNRQMGNTIFDYFFGYGEEGMQNPNQKNMPTGTGSGVIISEDGYIITNNHVIDKAEKLEVTLNNQQTYTATVIGTDTSTDIALLKIDEDQLPFLAFSDSDNVKVGEWVLAVGNPFGLNSTVTAGIISAKGRSINIFSKNQKNSPIESFIQTDAAINPGNSGGALVNVNGDLIGINTAISSHTGTYEGYGFAVPSNIARKIVEDLKNYGLVQRGYLGIIPVDMTDENMLAKYNSQFNTNYKTQEGVIVAEVTSDGSASKAGIEAGDIIVSIDSKKIKNYPAMSAIIGSKRPGDVVNVTVNRKGSMKTYEMELKDAKGSTKIRTKDDLTVAEILGASFEPLTEEQKINFGINSGIIVSDVDQNGKLQNIGIQRNYVIIEINGKPVNTQSDVEKILLKHKGTVSVKFFDRFGRIYQKGFQM